MIFAQFATDMPSVESLNIWVILASTLIPYVLKRVFPNLPIPNIGPAPTPKPAPVPVPVPDPVPAPTPIPNPLDPLALVWLLLKKFFPGLPDLAAGQPLTAEHFAALAKAEALPVPPPAAK